MNSAIIKPTKTGHSFDGYFTQTNGTGTQYVSSAGQFINSLWSSIADNTTLYAKWSAGAYTVTLDKQSGEGGTNSTSVTYGQAMPTITVPTRTGYIFGGYYSETNGAGTQYYTSSGTSAHTCDLTQNTTLYAKWTEDLVTITFNSNDD